MNVIEKETVVVPESTSDGAALAGIILALLIAAVVGFMVYSFSRPASTTYVERSTDTTHTQSLPAPTPAPVQVNVPAPAPSEPAPAPTTVESSTTVNQ